MGSSRASSGSQPIPQTNERISGPLPSLTVAPSPPAHPAPQQPGKLSRAHQQASSTLIVLGVALTITGFFLPTYLALPLLTSPSNGYLPAPWLSSYYASLTGVQILLFQKFFGYTSGFFLWGLQMIPLVAAINVLVLLSDPVRKFLLKVGKPVAIVALFLTCLVGPLVILALPVVSLLSWSMSLTCKASEGRRAWLKLLWPLGSIIALTISTTLFFSDISGSLMQTNSPAASSYHYLNSLGSGAWLSFAGLLIALLGGLLAFHARKQNAATP